MGGRGAVSRSNGTSSNKTNKTSLPIGFDGLVSRDPDDYKGLSKSSVLDLAKDLPYEANFIFDNDGNVIRVATDGNESTVEMTWGEDYAPFMGASGKLSDYHNHPSNGYAFPSWKKGDMQSWQRVSKLSNGKINEFGVTAADGTKTTIIVTDSQKFQQMGTSGFTKAFNKAEKNAPWNSSRDSAIEYVEREVFSYFKRNANKYGYKITIEGR